MCTWGFSYFYYYIIDKVYRELSSFIIEKAKSKSLVSSWEISITLHQ